MASGSFLAPFRWQVEYQGVPAAGALLTSAVSGSATPQLLYTDSALTVAHTNPVVADDQGVFPAMFMLAAAYRITITTSTGVSIVPATDHIYDLYQLFTATTQTANTVFAGPTTGVAAVPAFRALVAADMPAGGAPWTVVTTTSTGSQNDFAPGIVGNTIVRCNNATDLTLTGLLTTGIATGTQVLLLPVGAGNLYTANQNASSVLASRFINKVTTANTGAVTGSGAMLYVMDGTTARWRLSFHEQGAWITFAASVITGWAATPTSTIRYKLNGTQLVCVFSISGTSNTTAASFTVPYTPTGVTFGGQTEFAEDNTAALTASGRFANDSGANVTISVYTNAASAGWTNSGTKIVRGVWTGEVT